ncbi:unnamed protein product [Oikopleura dioica]|uniref:Uncharacterized protein n=1 Tax=Oikopleura dioica TaxID=34765 RepID=E4XU56_OIKDI|nr:unnamed protein product [Oikopleura dioica]
MCAWMAETWLESVDIAEEDVPMLTFKDIDDPLCAATDLGALEGMPDDMHFWRWCSREETEEEHGAHEEEEEETTVGPDGDAAPKLSHYTCGTDTGIHQGETGDEITDAWLEEPHIRHNNTIKTNDPYHPRQITIPVECEWPTVGEGNDPLGFNFRRGGPSYFKTESSIDLSVEIQLFKTRSFTEAHGTKPQFILTGQSEIFISVKFLEEVPSDVWMQLVHLWASPSRLVHVCSVVACFFLVASSSQDVFFAWIMGTCEQHSKVQFLESPSKQEARVALPVFMFEGKPYYKTRKYPFGIPVKSTFMQLSKHAEQASVHPAVPLLGPVSMVTVKSSPEAASESG